MLAKWRIFFLPWQIRHSKKYVWLCFDAFCIQMYCAKMQIWLAVSGKLVISVGGVHHRWFGHEKAICSLLLLAPTTFFTSTFSLEDARCLCHTTILKRELLTLVRRTTPKPRVCSISAFCITTRIHAPPVHNTPINWFFFTAWPLQGLLRDFSHVIKSWDFH